MLTFLNNEVSNNLCFKNIVIGAQNNWKHDILQPLSEPG